MNMQANINDIADAVERLAAHRETIGGHLDNLDEILHHGIAARAEMASNNLLMTIKGDELESLCLSVALIRSVINKRK